MPNPFIERTSDNAIADFVTLAPENPSLVTAIVEVLPSRPNVAGSAIRMLSKQGRPYRLHGMRNFSSINVARASLQLLRDNLVGELVSFTTFREQVFSRLVCLDVEEWKPPHEVLAMAGGISSAPTALWGSVPSGSPAAVGYFMITVMHVGVAV